MIRITAKSSAAREFIQLLADALELPMLDRVVEEVALRVYAKLVDFTPKGHSGNLRNQWTIATPGEAQRVLANTATTQTSRGIRFVLDLLAEGTGRYGPQGTDVVSPSGRPMYIPLTRRAAFGWRPGFRYGVDYVLAKKVRGIKPLKRRRVIENVVPFAEKLLDQRVSAYIRSKVGI